MLLQTVRVWSYMHDLISITLSWLQKKRARLILLGFVFSVFPASVHFPVFLSCCSSEADAFDAPLQIAHLAFHQNFINPSQPQV